MGLQEVDRDDGFSAVKSTTRIDATDRPTLIALEVKEGTVGLVRDCEIQFAAVGASLMGERFGSFLNVG